MKKVIIIVCVLLLSVSLVACQEADVVSKVAVTSFEAVLNTVPEKVAFDDANNGWSVTLPTGERFLWGKDFSVENMPDVMMEFDAAPFINAGLNVNLLPQEMFIYDSDTGKLKVHSELGNERFTYAGEAKPMDSFKKLVETHRDNIDYHEELDHYGVALDNGNTFEWAKDMGTNDKDVVFVLNPETIINAGVDPAKVEGWTFTKVEVKGDQGKPIEEDKFIKFFDLK